MAHDVFISYSSKDKHAADAVCAVLERNGIRCWIAPRDVLPGTTWGAALVAAIQSAKIMVLVFSGNANTSPQIEREVERAINHSVSVIPFRIEDVRPSHSLEYFISASHWLDAFTEPMEQHLETLARVVRHILELKQGEPAPSGPALHDVRPAPPAARLTATPPPTSAKQGMLIGAGAALAAVLVVGALFYLMQAKKTPMQTAAVAPPVVVAAPPASPPPAAQPAPVQPVAQPASAAPAVVPAPSQPASEPPLGPLLAGRWSWDALCSGTHWVGKFDLNATSSGRFDGNFDETVWYDTGKISNGSLDGSFVKFTRTFGSYIQIWTGHFAAGRIEGSVSASNGDCTFLATRD